jgi:hypothetical protein
MNHSPKHLLLYLLKESIIKMIPLKTVRVLTINKSQGLMLEKVIINT